MSEERKERCENCRFFELDEFENPATGGMCHRFPPVPVLDNPGSGARWLWSEVELEDWCGEFQQNGQAICGTPEKEFSDFAYSCSIRLRKALLRKSNKYCKGLDINSLAELCKLRDVDILRLKNVGRGTLAELKEKLNAVGLRLMGDEPSPPLPAETS